MTYLRFYILSLFFLAYGFSYGQDVEKFTYGGNKGTRYKGTVQVTYYIEQGDTKTKIDPRTSTIILDEYENDPIIAVEFHDLTLGLNDTYTKVRNSVHDKVYYLKGYRIPINVEGYRPTGTDTLSISAKKGHYGERIGSIRYVIIPPSQRKRVLFQISTSIVNGVTDRTWKSKTISRTFTVVPRVNLVEDTIAPPEQPVVAEVGPSRRRRSNSIATSAPIPASTPLDSLAPEVALEEKLWTKLQEQLLKNNKEAVLQHCQLYRMNCSNGIFTACTYSEDALYYMIAMQEDILPTNPLLLAYLQQYPKGKYIAQVTQWSKVEQPELRPVICDIAQIQADQIALVIGEIRGGEPPYYVNFYDDKKNNDYAIKSIRFTESNTCIVLEDLEIPEGNYRISVTDIQGQFFTEKDGIFIKKPIQIPKTISLSGVLLCLFGIGVGYKKYVHF